jgi:DNA invertase Pin-like site-specific DNA recombinase
VNNLDRRGGARAAVYTRISRDRIGAGLGVERQRQDCDQLIRGRGWSLVGKYQDNDISAYSGKTGPGYRQLLADIRGGHLDAVVAWHTDRLHRSPLELEEWIRACEARGVTTVTVRAGELDLSTAAGRMVARMLGAAARHESEQKAERIRRVRAQEARAGRAHGSLGYGYRRDPTTGAWAIVESEANVVQEIARRVLKREPICRITKDLNRRQVPTPKRVPSGWQPRNTKRFVCAGRFCGWREWTPATARHPRGRGRGLGQLVARGSWPPILARRETEAIRFLLFGWSPTDSIDWARMDAIR